MKRILRRFVAFTAMKSLYIFKGHIANPLTAPRDVRCAGRNEAMAASVLTYLRLSGLEAGNLAVEAAGPLTGRDNGKERAFTIWLQGEGEAPRIVKSCWRSMRRHLRQELVVLDASTVFDWITLPQHIVDKWHAGKMKAAHFTDICRVELLYRYGGIWVDATDFVTSPVPDYIEDADFFLFMAGHRVSAWFSYVQNCFIRSRAGNRLLGLWRAAIFRYWEKEDKAVNYFIHQLLFRYIVENNAEAAELFRSMPHIDQDPTHALWFGHKDDPYEKALYDSLTGDTFFQKTTYRDRSAETPVEGSVGEYMLNL